MTVVCYHSRKLFQMREHKITTRYVQSSVMQIWNISLNFFPRGCKQDYRFSQTLRHVIIEPSTPIISFVANHIPSGNHFSYHFYFFSLFMWNYYKSVTVISFPFLNSSCNCNNNSQEKKAKIYKLPHSRVMKKHSDVNIFTW